MARPSDPTEYAAWLKSNIALLYRTIGAEAGECRSCKAPLWWLITKNGKRAPFTAEGLNHFADCPNAPAHKKDQPA